MTKPIWEEEGTIGYAWNDLAVPFEAPIWQEDIVPRLRNAMARVANTDGSLMVGVYMGFIADLPEIDEDELRSLPTITSEAIRDTGDDLQVLAEATARLVQTHYLTLGETRDYLSLHIYEMPV